MKASRLLAFTILLSTQCGFAQTANTQSAVSATEKHFCLFAGTPPSDYPFTVVRQVKVGKGTYGSVNDVIPLMVDKARLMGADAIINYAGSQRFGFWPWRFVRPVVRGTAIKWASPRPVDCTAIGGSVPSGG